MKVTGQQNKKTTKVLNFQVEYCTFWIDLPPLNHKPLKPQVGDDE